jgi:hypothetical protein
MGMKEYIRIWQLNFKSPPHLSVEDSLDALLDLSSQFPAFPSKPPTGNPISPTLDQRLISG